MDLIEYLKIPYQHQGRSFKGADCFGLLRIYYEHELGVVLPDYDKPYDQEWWRNENLFLDLYKTYQFKKVKTFEKGNVILFKNTSSTPGHAGIVIDDSNFIHMTKDGVGVNNYLYGIWARQIHSIYKLKKNAHKTRRSL